VFAVQLSLPAVAGAQHAGSAVKLALLARIRVHQE